MSRHPQIEEIADDPDDFDIADYEPAARGGAPSNPSSLLEPRDLEALMQAMGSNAPGGAGGSAGGFHGMSGMGGMGGAEDMKYIKESDSKMYKNFQTIYPCYWDKRRSLKQGRRVAKELAVENPLAFTLVQACQSLGLKVVFEPTKTHPQDWANMGRVKVALDVEGVPKTHNVRNKRDLYKKIGEYLLAHPTTSETPLQFKIQGVPFDPSKPPGPVAVPKGWNMGTIFPLHSPAISGGGVSDNFLKEMMQEMGGAAAGGGGMPDMSQMARMAEAMGGLGGMGGMGAPGPSSGGAKKEKVKKIKR